MAVSGLIICGALWFIQNHDWSRLHQWYICTEFCISRSYIEGVKNTAKHLEHDNIPPKPEGTQIHIDFNDWGDPMRYQWENGRSIVRAAGKDKTLYTKDDIICAVILKKE